jgi:hypothetical protein
MEGRVSVWRGIDVAAKRVDSWRDVGATHLSINTMGIGGDAGAVGIDRHIIALAELADAIGLPPRPVS